MDQIEAEHTRGAFEEDVLHEIRLSDGQIQYYDVGSGEPILFVHGAFVNGDLWRNVFEPLSQDFRCLVPTLPLGGHRVAMDPEADLTPKGLVALLTEFLDELGVDRVTLVGNDTGGALCQVFLAEHPDRVERLVLTNCDAFDNFPPLAARPFTLGARVPGIVRVFALSLRSDIVRRLAFKILAKHPIQPQILSSYVESVSNDSAVQRDLRKVLLGVSSRYTIEAAQSFSTFDNPVLIVWAPDDPVFPLEDAEKLVESFPNAQFERVENSYAFISEDQPETLVKLLSEFLEVPLLTSS